MVKTMSWPMRQRMPAVWRRKTPCASPPFALLYGHRHAFTKTCLQVSYPRHGKALTVSQLAVEPSGNTWWPSVGCHWRWAAWGKSALCSHERSVIIAA